VQSNKTKSDDSHACCLRLCHPSPRRIEPSPPTVQSIYALVWRRAHSRRVSRFTSLYLLVFGVVWAPSLLVRVQVILLGPAHAPSFPLAALEALCMPLQGEGNALHAPHAHAHASVSSRPAEGALKPCPRFPTQGRSTLQCTGGRFLGYATCTAPCCWAQTLWTRPSSGHTRQ
jgi:hypothetical protein